jgi:hypothetical protein
MYLRKSFEEEELATWQIDKLNKNANLCTLPLMI